MVRLNLADGEIVWWAQLPGSGQQLATDTSYVTPVDGALGMVTREKTSEGFWRVSLFFLDFASGSVTGQRVLHESPGRPTHVRRFARDGGERLVFDHHVYEVSPAGESRR